jgi:N-methylhydantoinase A
VTATESLTAGNGASPDRRHRIAIDVGGTFVDYVLLDESTGDITIEKQLSTPERLVEEVSAGLERLPVGLVDVGRIFHGTTVVVNTIVQEQGVRVGLLTTAGFRDVLEIGRGSRPELYNPRCREPASLVARHLRREVPGRLDASGSEVVPLDLDRVDAESDALVQDGCEAIAICFLHSYANDAHERAAAERARERHPQISVTASSELVREWREFERTSTTVLNAYVQPHFRGYVKAIADKLNSGGYTRPLAVMQSNGGVSVSTRAADRPITTLESGPAGGVIGAHALAAELGLDNVICVDVGGTTCDVALIERGEIVERTLTRIAGRPVVGPTIDITSVGAGGGSIAWIDSRGALRVGPRSAGSSPGPVCFGLGGTEPTVTDCQLVLGRLDAGTFLGSRMELDVAGATAAVQRIGDALGLGLEETAGGVLRLAETNMMNAIRSITVERGLDPRGFTLMSYGGGGGLFAAAVSEELDIGRVIVPRVPANFSAWGIVTSDYREDNALTFIRPLHGGTAEEIASIVRTLSAQNLEQLESHGFDVGGVRSSARADLRFAGQEYTVTVPIDESWLDDPAVLLAGLQERFVEAHRRLYGHGEPGAPQEVVTVRVRSVAEVSKPMWPAWDGGAEAEPAASRETYFAQIGELRKTPVYSRDELVAGQRLAAPAIVEEWTSTTLVPPGWQATVDQFGNLVLTSTEREER